MPAVYKSTRDIPLASLTPFPGNARRGDVEQIRASLRRNGQYRALIVRDTGTSLVVLAGNHTMMALAAEGCRSARCEIIECDDDEARRINLADNRTAQLGGYDSEALAGLLASLDGDLEGSGWGEEDLGALLRAGDNGGGGGKISGDPDDLPELADEAVTQPGDLYYLGAHRLLAGDSASPADVARVTAGETVVMIHADPPYGMGKESEGVAGDNLYGPELDAFQMRWVSAWLSVLSGNGSVYIWGTAPSLWRLWWVGGLSAADDGGFMVRNEIVWDKGSAIGMRSGDHHSYPVASERCLFLMRGQQFLGNQNKAEYWEGYEPLRQWLVAERDKAGWTSKDVNELTGTFMAGHWFSRSQFTPISEKHYRILQEAAAGRAFTRRYQELAQEMFPAVLAGGRQHRESLAASLRETRTVFDNTHEPMTDVWRYGRVSGEERYGHVTPKPVAMAERVIKTSSRPGDLIGVPFAGTGPEFIAAHLTGRRAAGVELQPRYVDVIVKRWEKTTGIKPERERGGERSPVSLLGG